MSTMVDASKVATEVASKLLKFKEQLEAAKNRLAQSEGKLEALNKQLLDKYGCTSVEDGESKLDELEAAIASAKSELEACVAKLDAVFADVAA